MAFIKGVWRLLMVVKDALVLVLLLLFFSALYMALSATRHTGAPATGALLLQLDGPVVEQIAPDDPLAFVTGGGTIRQYRLRDVLHAIDTAAGDPAIKAVVVDLSRFGGAGQIAAQSIGASLDAVRKAGKPVYAWSGMYDDSGYAIAAHASEIWLAPMGIVGTVGPGGSQAYYKGLIDRLGITAHIYRVGTYKSFVEPFIRSDQSAEAEMADQALYDALWADWLAHVGTARPKAKVAAYARDPAMVATRFGGDTARAAEAMGLVDHIGDDAALGDVVAKVAGPDAEGLEGGFAAVSLEDYLRHHPAAARPGGVAVVTVAGSLVDGESGAGTAGGDTIAGLVADAVSDDSVKALVMRIDSPGGSVGAAEQIRRAVADARESGLPVVISMGDVAASGGYWISTASDMIFAEPGTVTGSIGVFGILPSFEGALARIGITSDGVRTTPLSGEPDIIGGVSPQFNAVAQAAVQNIYKRFVGLVAASRRLSAADAERVAEGRVWAGGTARQLRLIDRFGSLDDAVAEAARRAKLTGGDARARWFDPAPDPITRLASLFAARNARTAVRAASGDWLTVQATRRRQAALSAVDMAEAMLTGPAIRADCLPCRATQPSVAPPRRLTLTDVLMRGALR